MPAILLISTDIDDPEFVALASDFISHYADACHHPFVKVVHIDNWFGERWLGFAGKFKGMAGMRNRSLHARLPAPPFRPNRVVSAYDYDRTQGGEYAGLLGQFGTEKNGGIIEHLYRPGLYCWYSGNTRSNTTASLMIYDVTHEGNNAWYVSLDKHDDWGFTKCRNVSPEECIKIVVGHGNQSRIQQVSQPGQRIGH